MVAARGNILGRCYRIGSGKRFFFNLPGFFCLWCLYSGKFLVVRLRTIYSELHRWHGIWENGVWSQIFKLRFLFGRSRCVSVKVNGLDLVFVDAWVSLLTWLCHFQLRVFTPNLLICWLLIWSIRHHFSVSLCGTTTEGLCVSYCGVPCRNWA
jgi:hypothetical protein